MTGEIRRGGLVLLSGLPGTGKTTFALELVEAIGGTHLESDAIRRRIFPEPVYSPRENSIVFEEMERLAAKAVAAGGVAILDATNLTRRDRARFFRLCRTIAVPVVCVRLVAPDTVVMERLAAPREGYSQAGLAVYEAVRGRAESFRQPLVVLDTRFDIGPSVRLVARLLQESKG